MQDYTFNALSLMLVIHLSLHAIRNNIYGFSGQWTIQPTINLRFTTQLQQQRQMWVLVTEPSLQKDMIGKEVAFYTRRSLYPGTNLQIEIRDGYGDKQTIYATVGRGHQSVSRAGEWLLRSTVSKVVATILTMEVSQLIRRKDSLSIWRSRGARWCVFLPTYFCNNQHYNKK